MKDIHELDCGTCRGPFPPASEEQYARFAEELREQGILKEVRECL